MNEPPQEGSKLPWIVVGVLGCGALLVVLVLGSGFLAYLFMSAKPQPTNPTVTAQPAPPPVQPPAPGQPPAPQPVAPAPPAPPAPVAPAAPTVGPKPGYARGRVTREDGKPIAVPGAKISIGVGGIAYKSGEHVSIYPPVRPDGTYEVRLPDGRYGVSGSLEVPFQGQTYSFFLDPADGDNNTVDQDAATGVVKDFIWKLSGPKKTFTGRPAEPNDFTNWHGASVLLQFAGYREDLKKSVKSPPAGTKCTFTFVPKGPRIDGSEGKTITVERGYSALLGGLDGPNVPDLPIGDYTLTGFETYPDGSRHPLLMQRAYKVYGESVDVTFKAGSSIGPWPFNAGFTRPAD